MGKHPVGATILKSDIEPCQWPPAGFTAVPSAAPPIPLLRLEFPSSEVHEVHLPAAARLRRARQETRRPRQRGSNLELTTTRAHFLLRTLFCVHLQQLRNFELSVVGSDRISTFRLADQTDVFEL